MARSYDTSKFKTKFTESVLDEEALRAEERDKMKEDKQRIQEKRDIYDKYVKEMHWPKVSEKKRQEMISIKTSIHTSPHKKSSPKSHGV